MDRAARLEQSVAAAPAEARHDRIGASGALAGDASSGSASRSSSCWRVSSLRVPSEVPVKRVNLPAAETAESHGPRPREPARGSCAERSRARAPEDLLSPCGESRLSSRSRPPSRGKRANRERALSSSGTPQIRTIASATKAPSCSRGALLVKLRRSSFRPKRLRCPGRPREAHPAPRSASTAYRYRWCVRSQYPAPPSVHRAHPERR